MRSRHLLVLIVILYCFLIQVNCSPDKKISSSMNVMTFNLRYNTASDGENAWPFRKDMAASMIRFHDADLVGLQEALIDQIQDLAERLPDYGWFGIGRDDGKEAGEFMAIFYKKDRFEVLQDSTIWLSETPEKPGKGWDAACNRVITWGKFKDQISNNIFYHFNTHFDHMGKVARKNSATILLKSIESIAKTYPVVVTGDFNATPGSVPIQVITTGLEGTPDIKLRDSKLLSQYPHHGPNGTVTRFQSANVTDQPIDYIFIKNNVQVVRHGTLSDSFEGRFPTDHMPVMAEIVIE